MPKEITKRDGRVVKFELAKLVGVIEKAGMETGEYSPEEAKRLAEIAVHLIKEEKPNVETIQDIVEQVLMAAGHYKTAKEYILYREKRSDERRVERIIGVRDDLDLSPNQLKVMENRYLLKDEDGKVIETPSELFRRVAKNLAIVETKEKRKKVEEDFFEVMSRLEFLPAGRTLNNAGTPQSQLANCFVLPVEDSMEGIFDSVKYMAMIHQRGGGCIAAGASVVTSHSGIVEFAGLYDSFGGKQSEIKTESGWKIDLRGKNIETISLDPEKGEYVKDTLQSIWRYELPAARIFKIIAEGSLEVTTSDWHPFFVFENNNIIEKRADEISPGDYLVGTNETIANKSWLFDSIQYFEGIKIDKDMGWLLGYILGDGSFGHAKTSSIKQNQEYVRLRVFDGEEESLLRVGEILATHTGEITKIQKDPRSKTKYISTTNLKIVPILQRLLGIYGPKNETLRIPEIVMKSPIEVIGAVLAGLLDSDGYVSGTRRRVDFATESQTLAEQIVGLLSLLGIHGVVRSRQPRNLKWKMMYEVKIDDARKLRLLWKYLGENLTNRLKRNRLQGWIEKSVRETNIFASPLEWEPLKIYLQKAGINTNSTLIHKQAVLISGDKIWLNHLKWGGTLSIPHMEKVLIALLKLQVWSKQELITLQKWSWAHQSLRKVERVERPSRGGDFYDFSTENHHNYLAGVHGLTAVHNTGFNFSKLRPRGDVVTKSSGGFATGPISFMKVFDIATRQVMQGGKKRGANMGILNVDHPDVMEFIAAKQETGEIENFNISVGVTDAFMKAVENDTDWALKNPRTGETVSTIRAKGLMSQLVTSAWRNGDPGLIFLDPINRNNPLLKAYGRIEATNPCGEQPLHPFDACNLGSLNLAKMIVNEEINWDRLEKVLRVGVRMLDDVIDACKYPLPQITETVKANRRIGLGVMGWADALYQMRVAYDSEKGVKLAAKIAKFIQETTWNESAKIAKEKGTFPRWKESSFVKTGIKVRNVAITTIAPTGSISMLSDCSSGIEPVFALAYTKNVVSDAGLSYVNRYFEHELSISGWADGDPEHKVKDRILREVANSGSLNNITGVPDKVKAVYRTAHDISPEWHVKMQAAWQKYTDNAVSKTINFPHNATIEDVENAYILAWKMGCKGITIYRDGSRDVQILSVGKGKPTDVKATEGKQIIQSKIKTETLKERGKKAEKLCPECGGKLAIEEGCAKCYGCGYSVCNG